MDSGSGPEGTDRPESGSFSIGGDGEGRQPALFEPLQPWKAGGKPFLGHVQVREDGLIGSMHERHQAPVLMEVRAIQDQVREWATILALGRGLLKPVVFDPLELGGAMTGEVRELSDGIMFPDPELEPMSLLMSFVLPVLPDEGLGTNGAPESLLTIGALTEALHTARTTKRTMLFFSSWSPFIKVV